MRSIWDRHRCGIARVDFRCKTTGRCWSFLPFFDICGTWWSCNTVIPFTEVACNAELHILIQNAHIVLAAVPLNDLADAAPHHTTNGASLSWASPTQHGGFKQTPRKDQLSTIQFWRAHLWVKKYQWTTRPVAEFPTICKCIYVYTNYIKKTNKWIKTCIYIYIQIYINNL